MKFHNAAGIRDAVKKTGKRYESMDNLIAGCQVISFDWRYVYLNSTAIRHARKSRKELLGRTMMDAYPGIEKTEMFRHVRRCMEKRAFHRMENSFTYQDGSEGWFLLNMEPVSEGLLVVSQDITAQKRMEMALHESEDKYRTLVESSPEAITILDRKGAILFLNKKSASRFGASPAKITGKRIWEYIPKKAAAFSESMLREIIRTGESREIVSPVSIGGSTRFFRITLSPVKSKEGKFNSVLVISSDITEIKKSEQRIMNLNRLYSMLSDSNQAIVRFRDMGRIAREICRIIVRDSGMKMAWLGLHDPAHNIIKPIAHFGVDPAYLKSIKISPQETATMRVPIKAAFLTGKPFVCNDWSTARYMRPWGAAGAKYTYRSSASVPILKNGKSIGTLNIYSAAPGFFDDEIMGLVQDLASDISFAFEKAKDEQQRRSVENTLRGARRRLEAIINNTPDVAIESYDMNGKVLSWNRAAEKIFGWKKEDAIGKNIGRLILGRHSAALFIKDLRRINAGGKPFPPTEWEFKRKDGTMGWVYSTIFSVPASVSSKEFVCMDVDITERRKIEKALRESEAKYSSVVENSSDAIAILQDNVFKFANRALSQLGGYPLDQIIGKPISFAVVPGFRHITDSKYRNRVKRGGPTEKYVIPVKRKDGVLINVELFSKIIKYDGRNADLIIVRDITERRRLDDLMRNYTLKLESEVNARTSEVLQEKRRVEELSAVKDQFIRDISHELKTPLSVIMGNLSLLRDIFPIGKEKEWASLLNLLDRNTARLEKSINQMLQLSKLQKVELQRTRVLLNELVEEVYKEYLPLSEIKSITLSIDAEPVLMLGDGDLLRLAIGNLVSNAIKFTSRGSVSVRLRGDAHSATIAVTDTGIGISEKNQKKLFLEFFKVDPIAPGTGIGLSIAKEIVKKHGGTIRVKSKLGEGSTFEITLPRGVQT
ncbi:MAG: PAS domain S-box protein [Candidatus ainarchaeum sp.]|nr:PAS domain S-box protein [Candidatus ainarchaeum sp.]